MLNSYQATIRPYCDSADIILFVMMIMMMMMTMMMTTSGDDDDDDDSFIHSGDLYSASSRHYYSEAHPVQSRPKKDLREM